MPVQTRLCWCAPDDPEIWERVKAERLLHVLLPHCAKPTRRDWEKNVSETLMAKVWARRVPEGYEEAPLPDGVTSNKNNNSDGVPSSVRAPSDEKNINSEGASPVRAPSTATSPVGVSSNKNNHSDDAPATSGPYPWEWAGICYLSNGFGMTPYVHFALFRSWRSEAEIIGKNALAWIFRALKCPAVLGWTPACFKHVEPLLRAWGFKDLARIPQGFPFVEKEGGGLYFRDGVLRIRRK